MNFLTKLYYEVIILIELFFLTIKNYFSNKGNIMFCIIDSLYLIFDYNFFRIVNSSVGKYISVQNVEENKYELALNFGSYDYMGFSNIRNNRDSLIKLYNEYNIFPNYEITKNLEYKITSFLQKESNSDTIVINGGYQGNSDYLPYILENYTILFSQSDNHASIIKGIKRSSIESRVFEKVIDLDEKLKSVDFEKEKVIVIIEGIYSMSGHISPLLEYLKLKEKYPFHLYIDEAHSCGCIGKKQKGICDFFDVDINKVEYLMGTFSKTFNAHGSYICGPKKIIKKMKEERDKINDNTLPAVTSQYILSIYKYLEENHNYINRNFNNIVDYTYNKISEIENFEVISDKGSPVICIRILYGLSRLIGKYLIKNNVATVVVGHPAVSLPYAIVRICVSMSHTIDDIDYLISCLKLNADKSKLTLPETKDINYYDDNKLDNINLLKNYSLGSSGPSGFFGYLHLNNKLEELINSFTKKKSCLFMQNSKSGYNDIIENIIKRYKYTKICIENEYYIKNKNALDYIIENVKNCDKINYNQVDSNKNEKILFINLKEDTENNLKEIEDLNVDCSNYRFIIGKLENICNGIGCFWSYNENEYGKIQKRTQHSSYVYSANLPAYVINQNINNFKQLIKYNKKFD